MAELLISYKADPNAQQNDGDSPLHHAAFRGDVKMVELLLKCSGDPNLNNFMVIFMQFGRTPLHYAVDCGHVESVRVMLQYGADSSLKDKHGKNAFDLCISNEVSSVLRQYSSSPNESPSLVSAIGEVTTYFVSDLGENKNAAGLRCSLVSPMTEKSSLTGQLYPIYGWLEKRHLEQYYELLVEAGYDDIQVMVSQMNGPLPISDKNLKEIGISKAGHRRHLLIKLEEEAGFGTKLMIKRHIREKSEGILVCCVNANATRHHFTPPSLGEWLNDLELSHVYTQLTEAGFDSYDLLIDVQGSLHPLTNKQLEKEIKIISNADRVKLLNRLDSDVKAFYQDQEPMKISFEEPKRIVCESCHVF